MKFDYDSIKEKVKSYVQSQIDMCMEYETEGDAKDSYYTCVQESYWPEQCEKISEALEEKFEKDIPVSVLMDMPELLDSVELLPGSIYGAYNDDEYIIVDCYPVQEIEVQIDYSNVRLVTDSFLLNSDIDEILKEEFCVHPGNHDSFYVYESTDAVWYAALKLSDILECLSNEDQEN